MAMAAAHVRDANAGLEPGFHAVQRRDPVLYQVGDVPGAKKPRAALEHAVVVLKQADAVTGREGFLEAILDSARRERDLEAADHERGAVLFGEHQRLFGAEAIAPGVGEVLDV